MPISPRNCRREFSRRNRFRSAICSPARSCPGFALVALYILYLVAMAIFFPKSSPAMPADPSAPRGIAMARKLIEVLVAPLLLILAVLGSILGGIATPTEAASIGAVGAILLAARKAKLSRDHRPDADQDRADHDHDLRHPDRRDLVQSRLPRARRRRSRSPLARQSAGRGGRRGVRGDDRDVPARLRDGRVRDHFRGGADRRAGPARHAGRRSGLARRHDGGQPADLLHAPAARPDLVLSARRGAAGGHDRGIFMSASFPLC